MTASFRDWHYLIGQTHPEAAHPTTVQYISVYIHQPQQASSLWLGTLVFSHSCRLNEGCRMARGTGATPLTPAVPRPHPVPMELECRQCMDTNSVGVLSGELIVLKYWQIILKYWQIIILLSLPYFRFLDCDALTVIGWTFELHYWNVFLFPTVFLNFVCLPIESLILHLE